ncbi:hypothetical protein SUBVAR_07068 [Subdoligranulum variabile DSM 15176]|uniref:Uncharacterized protein n=1 Tax=Subdoligranulum variabile DSM 15176 TaxID=411471 RepID=D1PRQ9_9FIRM|nr:hypothetical protein SUBVAR_07068 [Subdoligranulum variabile DSM 15176]
MDFGNEIRHDTQKRPQQDCCRRKAALWGGLNRSGSVGWHKMAAKIL